MPGFLVDEDLPRNLAALLRNAGFEAHDVRDVGLRGSSDSDVFAYAQTHGLCLVSADLEFGNLLLFPLGAHHGIVLVRFPNEVSVLTLNQAILAAVQQFQPVKPRGLSSLLSLGVFDSNKNQTQLFRSPPDRLSFGIHAA